LWDRTRRGKSRDRRGAGLFLQLPILLVKPHDVDSHDKVGKFPSTRITILLHWGVGTIRAKSPPGTGGGEFQ